LQGVHLLMAYNLFENANPQYFDSGDPNNCLLCNRPLKSGYLLIEVGIDGYEFGTTQETDSQGSFGIGPECVKKVRK